MTQEEYISILFNDCGFKSTIDRKSFISRRFPGKNYSDELDGYERSMLINELKDIKLGSTNRYTKYDEE